MELSRKQVIWISVVSAIILALTVAAVLILAPGDGEEPVQPTAGPPETVRATASPSPVPTPTPTVFRLPLVPRWDTPRPTAGPSDPAGALMPGAFVPTTAAPERQDPWV